MKVLLAQMGAGLQAAAGKDKNSTGMGVQHILKNQVAADSGSDLTDKSIQSVRTAIALRRRDSPVQRNPSAVINSPIN